MKMNSPLPEEIGGEGIVSVTGRQRVVEVSLEHEAEI